jgi:hypothetical protein
MHRGTLCVGIVCAVAASASIAEATPQFARTYRVDCSYCHTAPPRLNERGLRFVARAQPEHRWQRAAAQSLGSIRGPLLAGAADIWRRTIRDRRPVPNVGASRCVPPPLALGAARLQFQRAGASRRRSALDEPACLFRVRAPAGRARSMRPLGGKRRQTGGSPRRRCRSQVSSPSRSPMLPASNSRDGPRVCFSRRFDDPV